MRQKKTRTTKTTSSSRNERSNPPRQRTTRTARPGGTSPKKRPQAEQTKSTRQARRIENHKASERLQKVLAGAGLGSRRALEKEIESGSIRVNGTRATLGEAVSQGDRIDYNGRRLEVIAVATPSETLIYFKPAGEITTKSDPEGRKTVFERLPRPARGRWVAVGRLDLNTSGLLLLTTDGELANRMMHPSGQVDREYLCRIRGTVNEEQLEQLKRGVTLDDGP